jgi:LysM repeat protein
MKNLWQLFTGVLIALISIGLLLGGLSLSLAEGISNATSTSTSTPTATPTMMPTSSPTLQPFTLSVSTTPAQDSPTQLPTLLPTWTPTLTSTAPPPPTNCPPPLGWLVYFVQPGETLDSIATRYRISTPILQGANCLVTKELLPGVVIYVPPMRTQTPLPCGAPYGWVVYTVQPGDTLYRLSQTYGITVGELQRANCMGASTLLHTRQALYVPYSVPPLAPPTSPGMLIAASTQAPSQSSNTLPAGTLNPAASDTPAEIPTATPIPATP